MAAAGTRVSSPDPLDFLPFLPAMASGQPLHVRTPIRDSMTLSKVAGTTVYLKLESSQPSGSFKIRGIGHLCKTVQDGFCIIGARVAVLLSEQGRASAV